MLSVPLPFPGTGPFFDAAYNSAPGVVINTASASAPANNRFLIFFTVLLISDLTSVLSSITDSFHSLCPQTMSSQMTLHGLQGSLLILYKNFRARQRFWQERQFSGKNIIRFLPDQAQDRWKNIFFYRIITAVSNTERLCLSGITELT